MKPYILIVEDEAILYDGLSQALLKEYFTVSDYTKSYDEAIESICKKRPDIVLLDIDLQGEKDGLDLGRILDKKYKIPFIYLTSLDDDRIFNKGLQTNHEQFIVKTKPVLNTKEVIRAIDTVLKRKKEQPDEKEYIFGLKDTLQAVKQKDRSFISKAPIAYKDIICFRTDNVEKNYCKIITGDNKEYLVKYSLSNLKNILPAYFTRVNDCCILNLSPSFLDGRINGNTISVLNKKYGVSPTYKKEVERCFDRLYNKPTK